MSDTVAVVLLIGLTAYAVFGGADFGAGILTLFTPDSGTGPPAARRVGRGRVSLSSARSDPSGRPTTSG